MIPLLDKSCTSNVYEALLLSISLDHDAISETIIRHPKYWQYEEESEQKDNVTDGIVGTPVDDTIFSTDVTPLMLASQKNQFQVCQNTSNHELLLTLTRWFQTISVSPEVILYSNTGETKVVGQNCTI